MSATDPTLRFAAVGNIASASGKVASSSVSGEAQRASLLRAAMEQYGETGELPPLLTLFARESRRTEKLFLIQNLSLLSPLRRNDLFFHLCADPDWKLAEIFREVNRLPGEEAVELAHAVLAGGRPDAECSEALHLLARKARPRSVFPVLEFYVSARGVVLFAECIEVIRRLPDIRFSEPLLAYLASPATAEQHQLSIIGALRGYLVHFKISPRIFHKLARRGPDAVRASALGLLSSYGKGRHLTRYFRSYDKESSELVRLQLLALVTARPVRVGVEMLLKVLRQCAPSELYHQRARAILEEIPREHKYALVRSELRQSRGAYREVLISELVRERDLRDLGLLRELMSQESDPHLREKIALGLTAFGDYGLDIELFQLLGAEPNLALALARGFGRVLYERKGEIFLELLRLGRGVQTDELRVVVLGALPRYFRQHIPTRDLLEEVITLARQAEDMEVRRLAIAALAQAPQSDLAGSLLELQFQEENPELRRDLNDAILRLLRNDPLMLVEMVRQANPLAPVGLQLLLQMHLSMEDRLVALTQMIGFIVGEHEFVQAVEWTRLWIGHERNGEALLRLVLENHLEPSRGNRLLQWLHDCRDELPQTSFDMRMGRLLLNRWRQHATIEARLPLVHLLERADGVVRDLTQIWLAETQPELRDSLQACLMNRCREDSCG
jgi:hypothetical protein